MNFTCFYLQSRLDPANLHTCKHTEDFRISVAGFTWAHLIQLISCNWSQHYTWKIMLLIIEGDRAMWNRKKSGFYLSIKHFDILRSYQQKLIIRSAFYLFRTVLGSCSDVSLSTEWICCLLVINLQSKFWKMWFCRGKDLSALEFGSLHIVYLHSDKRLIVNSRNCYGNPMSQNYCQLATEV